MVIFSRYTWWVAAMITLALFLTAANQVGVLSPVQGVFLKVTAPAENVLDGIFRPIATFLSDAGHLRELQDENRRLRIENEQLRNENTQLQIDAERVKELEAALNINQADTSQTRVAANVVSRDYSAFTDLISIDRGSGDGIDVGMNVLSSQGTLIGTVTRVFDDHAFVRLITDSKSRVNAKVQDGAAGVVRGGPNRTITFDYADADVKVGDTILTSGLGGNYQANLPIGRVTKVEGTAQDLFQKVEVEPLVRLSTAQTVLVLTSFHPQRIVLDDDTP
ncbi:MAG: rod shape-determining protein MreC [Hyphomicrobiales bacterium]